VHGRRAGSGAAYEAQKPPRPPGVCCIDCGKITRLNQKCAALVGGTLPS